MEELDRSDPPLSLFLFPTLQQRDPATEREFRRRCEEQRAEAHEKGDDPPAPSEYPSAESEGGTLVAPEMGVSGTWSTPDPVVRILEGNLRPRWTMRQEALAAGAGLGSLLRFLLVTSGGGLAAVDVLGDQAAAGLSALAAESSPNHPGGSGNCWLDGDAAIEGAADWAEGAQSTAKGSREALKALTLLGLLHA